MVKDDGCHLREEMTAMRNTEAWRVGVYVIPSQREERKSSKKVTSTKKVVWEY